MDLEAPACKEALGIVPLVVHEETRAKPVPKQPPPRLSRTPLGGQREVWWLEEAVMILNTEGQACLPPLPTLFTCSWGEPWDARTLHS
jgi:hypothetical protein